MLPGRFSLLLVCLALASVGLLFALGFAPTRVPEVRLSAPVIVNVRGPAPVTPSPPAPEPPPPPPAPPPAEAPAPKVETFHWLATVKSHYVSRFTYGGDDEPTLVRNRTKRLPAGTPCRISVRPTAAKPHECELDVVCGTEEFWSGGANSCDVVSWHEPGRGTRADLSVETRGGSCNGGTQVDIDSKQGSASFFTDNSYGGPSIVTERISVTFVGAGRTDD